MALTRIAHFVILTILVSLFSGILNGQVVDIPDANLEAALRAPEVLDFPTGNITVEHMESLTTLDLYLSDIADIAGLEYAANLQVLSLFFNPEISDLTPLSNLTQLADLDLRYTGISNASQIPALPALRVLQTRLTNMAGLERQSLLLEELYLSYSEATDISPLQNLTELRVLNLANMEITDISALSSLIKMSILDLSYNQIEDIGALSQMAQIVELNLNNNSITDLGQLQHMTQLTELRAESCSLADISALAGLSELIKVYLSDNDLTDLSALSQLRKLNQLHASSNHLETFPGGDDALDIATIAENNPSASISCYRQRPIIPDPNLVRAIELTYNLRSIFPLQFPITDTDMSYITHLHPDFVGVSGITDLTGLQYCYQMESMSLLGCDVRDLEPIANMSLLNELYLDGNVNIADYSVLSGLDELAYLSLFDSGLSFIDFVASFTTLEWLDLSDNSIEDLSPLSSLTNLKSLNISNNSVHMITPLASMTGLDTVYLDGNALNLKTGGENVGTIIAMQESGVVVTYNLTEVYEVSLDWEEEIVALFVGPIFLNDQVTLMMTTDLADADSWEEVEEVAMSKGRSSGEWCLETEAPAGTDPVFYRAVISRSY